MAPGIAIKAPRAGHGVRGFGHRRRASSGYTRQDHSNPAPAFRVSRVARLLKGMEDVVFADHSTFAGPAVDSLLVTVDDQLRVAVGTFAGERPGFFAPKIGKNHRKADDCPHNRQTKNEAQASSALCCQLRHRVLALGIKLRSGSGTFWPAFVVCLGHILVRRVDWRNVAGD